MSENSGMIQYIPDSEFTFSRKIAEQLVCRADEFLITATADCELGGEETTPKSKLKTAPEFFGADLVVAVLPKRSISKTWFKNNVYIDPEAVRVKVIAVPPLVADTSKFP